ncbi:MAG: type II secretion system protein GspG [Proteobacteria bacterium]|nr:type II secretion system protein GspG [Pseudomonadota bacterium]NDC23420.1 type II secretion system protein GspG [Pseudomonadota bacterium]NDD03589.1 type II secretion system protein GspG [Pseudomonadota bacterium]NDG25685.1 type II secretion system protein GspG [Pseudomonadota bacterium]
MNKKKLQQKKREKGFTLVEVMIVLALVVMLGSYAGPKLIGLFNKGKQDNAKIQIAGFGSALQAYYLAHSYFPTTAQGLQALISKPSVGKVPDNYPDGGYLGKKEIPKDPWGNQYRYECEDGQNYTITSDGPDGQPGSGDDIKSD